MSSLKVALHQIRTALLAQMQYRVDFIIQLFMAFFWVTWSVTPMWVVYRLAPDRLPLSNGLLVLATFLMLKGFLEGMISPNLTQIVDHIRRGTLDFLLLKPIDAQLMVSTRRFVLARLVDASVGFGLAVYAATRFPEPPSAQAIALALVLLGASAAIMYALWLMVISSAFWFVRVDNLSYLFNSFFDAARWPRTLFPGAIQFIFTFVVPVLAMTSFPAFALAGELAPRHAAYGLGLAAALLFASRRMWLFAVSKYSSASS